MPKYRVMNRRLDAYSIEFDWWPDADRWMEGHREYIESESSYSHGDVLVELAPKLCGFKLIAGIDISHCPRRPLKFGHKGSRKKTWKWLCFEVGLELEYHDVPLKIVKDFVGDWQGKMVRDIS